MTRTHIEPIHSLCIFFRDCGFTIVSHDGLAGSVNLSSVKFTSYSLWMSFLHSTELFPKVDSITQTLTYDVPYYVWKEHGIGVKLPENSLPDSCHQCEVTISTFLPNCVDKFPANTEAVSSVINIVTSVELSQPLDVTIAHIGGRGAVLVCAQTLSAAECQFSPHTSGVSVEESSASVRLPISASEQYFVLVSSKCDQFCAHTYYDQEKRDIFIIMAKQIPSYKKVKQSTIVYLLLHIKNLIYHF